METDSGPALWRLSSAARALIDSLVDARLDPDLRERIALLGAQRNQNEFGFDPFGYNPDALKYVLPAAAFLYRDYFRVEVHGIENVPEDGRVLLIANHSGQIPIDGFMIGTSLVLDADPPRVIRSMVERWTATLPFVSWLFPRLGQIVGTPENCRALFDREEAILVFPEGVRGVNKTWSHRYQLAEFGLGFMRLALEGEVPIVPVGVVGAEEQIISLYNAKRLGAMLGMPALPIGPGTLLGPLGMIPMPVKYHLHFGEPMTFSGSPDDENAVIEDKVEQVKDAIRALLERGLQERNGIFS